MNVAVLHKTLFTDTGSIWPVSFTCLTPKLQVNYIFPSRPHKMVFLFVILSKTKIRKLLRAI